MFQIPQGLSIQLNAMLPIEETSKACNIESKQEVSILTGKLIHCYKCGNVLQVSPEMYNVITNI